MNNTALIFGASGQDGYYLTKLLLEKGYSVVGTTRRKDIKVHPDFNHAFNKGLLKYIVLDILDQKAVQNAVMFYGNNEIYNLAGQTSVGISFHDPYETIQSIATGTLNILESVRLYCKDTKFYNACSSECFGNTISPANETTNFAPCSPYGVAKASAFWYVKNYREAFNIKACSGILFNHESPMRPKHFVTAKIVQGAVDIAMGRKEYIELGNLSIVRDWGWAPKYVEAMWLMLQAGGDQDFVISSGRSHSLEFFCKAVFKRLGLNASDHIRVVEHMARPCDIIMSCGDSRKAKELLGWESKVSFDDLIGLLVDAALSRQQQDGK